MIVSYLTYLAIRDKEMWKFSPNMVDNLGANLAFTDK